MHTPFTAALIERDRELGLSIRKSAQHAVFTHLPRVAPWYAAIMEDTLFPMIGMTDMVDEFASEMLLAIESGQEEEEAFAQACKVTLKSWRKLYDHKAEREQSIQEAEDHLVGFRDNDKALDLGEMYPELSVEDEYPSVAMHSEWGPKHLLVEKALSVMTDQQREAVLLYAETRHSPSKMAEVLGTSLDGAWKRVWRARQRVLRILRDELVDSDLVRL